MRTARGVTVADGEHGIHADSKGIRHTCITAESSEISLDPVSRANIRRLDPQLFEFEGGRFDQYTHYLFRYPAKFHPPAVRALIERYSGPGDHIMDPFCGSGTLLVESAVSGRSATGSDIDPVAVFVSRAKTQLHDCKRLTSSGRLLMEALADHRRPDEEYEARKFEDVSAQVAESVISSENLWIPRIPNLYHWFRRYVVVDLARIHNVLMGIAVPRAHRELFLLCFASIIRAASNADPVPVSGLEVTSHMRRKEAQGRIVNPFELFQRAIDRAIHACASFSERADRTAKVTVFQADATELKRNVREKIDCVITSPPYHNAVDYYRRHQLEMYWLGLTQDHNDRLALLPRYIGRSRVRQRHPLVEGASHLPLLVQEWEREIRESAPKRADAFRHYMRAMQLTLRQLALMLDSGSYAVFVLGQSSWNGTEIPTVQLFEQLAKPLFRSSEQLWYPVKNRYMSYSRHNDANIDREYVLAFQRCADSPATRLRRVS